MKNIKHNLDEKQRFQSIIEATNLGTWEWELQTGKLILNQAWAKIIGYSLENLEPTINTWRKYTHPDDLKVAEEILNRVFAKELPFYECELRMKHKDGNWIWILDKGEVISWSLDEKPLFMVGSHTDITQIKQATEKLEILLAKNKKSEEELKIEHEKAQNYLNLAGVMLLALDNKGIVTLINQKGCQILEADEKDILGMNWFDNFIPKKSHKTVKTVFNDLFDKKIASQQENEILTAKGNIKIINWYNTVLYDNDNNIKEVFSSGEDITEKKYIEYALSESENRFQMLYHKAPIGFQSLDVNGYFKEVNETWLNILGYQREEVIGKWFGNFLSDEYRESFIKRFEFFKREGRVHSEFEMLHKDGSKIFIGFDGTVGYDDNHQFIQTYCTLNDITQQRKTQEKLRLSENNLKLAQSIASIGSWELHLKDNFIWASEAAFNIYEMERNDGFIDLHIIQDMVCEDDRAELDQALKELIVHNKPYNVTFKILTKKGKEKYINSKASLFTDVENNPFKVIGVIHDITELKLKELELEYLSERDYLTNLYNRRYYFEQFRKFDQPKFYPLGIMMLDVNGLKIVNDAFGHTVGDEALTMIGNTLKVIFEKKDVISRIGGDEFTVLLPNTTAEKLQEYKDRLIKDIKKQTINNIEMSLAVGYELKNNKTEDIDEMQKQAENHMYRHKTTEGSSVRSKAINAILMTLTDKYDTEKRHSAEVSHLCKEIGIMLELRDDEIKELEQAGLFHDIGKISIPDSILNKPGKLSEEEFEIIKTHTEVGYQILRAADEYSDLAIHALYHHERWDGKGYPAGLKDKDIPLFSRIICVVDAYEAMTADRPYRNKLSREYAVAEIKRCSGTQFDPEIAQLFVEKILHKNW